SEVTLWVFFSAPASSHSSCAIMSDSLRADGRQPPGLAQQVDIPALTAMPQRVPNRSGRPAQPQAGPIGDVLEDSPQVWADGEIHRPGCVIERDLREQLFPEPRIGRHAFEPASILFRFSPGIDLPPRTGLDRDDRELLHELQALPRFPGAM